MIERLDIEGLRALVAIASHGGVTRAAENLALSQPAVSHKIKRMETVLGCDLLARRSGGPLFTEAGTQLLDYARRIMDLHDEALAALGRKSLAGSIRLGMTEDTTGGDIARILGRFTRLHPDVEVSTKIGQSLTLSDWLDRGEVDIAVLQVLSHDVRRDDLILYEDLLHWIKSRNLQLDKGGTVPFLAFDQNCFYKNWVMSEGTAHGHTFRIVLECPSVSGILSATRAGLGVALMNSLYLSSDLEIIDGIFPKPPPIAYVVRSRPKSRNVAAKALMQEITAGLSAPIPIRVA